MKQFIIALKNLNIDDALIIKIINDYSEEKLIELFINHNNSIIVNDLALLKYEGLFNDSLIVEKALQKAINIIEENKKYGIKTLLYNSRYYPCNLKKIDNPPPVLYIKGANFTNKHKRLLACVGTRTPTKFAVNATNYLIPQWANEEFIIVSGLAIGVDTLSHVSCVESGGITVAVLAHGLDTIYPKENEYLAQRILNNGGTLISEYPIGTKADKFRFVKRNRLIVGLALGTVVFEMKVKSGSMHSIDFTVEQGKPVFCPNPGNEVNNEQLEGLRYLLNNKIATLIANGSSFETPIFYLGYKLKHSPVHLSKIKETYIKSLLNNTSTQANINEVLYQLLDKNNLKKKSITVNNLQYEEFKKIAALNYLSVKELLNVIIEQVVINNK